VVVLRSRDVVAAHEEMTRLARMSVSITRV